jgi:Domain of unknown function (DUF4253)
MAEDQAAIELHKKIAEIRAKILAQFPFETVIVPGTEALAAWEDLKRGNRGAPVIIGNEDSFSRVAEDAVSNWEIGPPREELDIANGLRHPADLRAMRKESGLQYSPDCEPHTPPLGEWPAEPPEEAGLTVVYEYVPPPAKPLPPGIVAGLFAGDSAAFFAAAPRGRFEVSEKVWIALIPADDWTAIPAYLNWGGWNANPAPEYHVAALRSWRDRYGAELVGMSGDVMNVRVSRRPETREEALELAREHYDYCDCPIYRGVGSVSNLAAALMAHNWWYFWWD